MIKTELHPRNRHRNRYDFPALTRSSPELSRHVMINVHGDESIDFADPTAVKALNRAILKHFYGINDWDIPEGFLCPPIPGRADYLHHVADLLGGATAGESVQGGDIRVLDIGTGANCVYPLIGQREYGWTFVGTDVDARALASAAVILARNPGLKEKITLRLQKSPRRIFEGVVLSDETFHLSVCNPPFHASLEDAHAGTQRKWRNLGREQHARKKPLKNFGGHGAELWCEGGERAFILRMIQESAVIGDQCRWFTTLVSKEANLTAFDHALEKVRASERQIIEMNHGQKKSRILAWTYTSATQDSTRTKAGKP